MDDNKVLIDEQNLYDIADAIRRKNGETTKYLPDEMPPAIDAIPTGSEASLAGNLAVAYEGLVFPVAAGTHCIYDDMYYVAVAPIVEPEPFTPAHWQRITAGVEIQQIGTDLITTQGAVLELASDVDDISNTLSGGQLRKVFTSNSLSVNGTISDIITPFTLYGRCTQNGVPTPSNPVAVDMLGDTGYIVIHNNDSTISIPASNGLPGIRVSSGGNFTDPNGDMWICDTIDKASHKYIKRVEVRTISANSASFSQANNYIIAGLSSSPYTLLTYPNQLCNRFSFVTSLTLVTNTPGTFKVHVTGSGTGGTNMYMHTPDGVTDTASAREWLANNPVMVYFPLLTPETYDLTTEQMEALDSIFSGDGQTTIAYMDTNNAFFKTALFVNANT